MAGNNKTSQYEEESKNRDVFTTVHTIYAIPASLFMFGVIAIFALYFLFKSFFVSTGFAFLYFPLMYHIHKDDVKGLTIWLKCAFDKTLVWESGRRKVINLIFLQSKDY